MKLLPRIVLLVLAFTGAACSQAARFDSVAQTTQSINGTTVTVPAPSASITVCSYPATVVSGSACTNKASVCPDITAVGCTTTAPNNPVTADAQGNFGFWTAGGVYQYTVCPQSGTCQGPFNAVIPFGITGTSVSGTSLTLSGILNITGGTLKGYDLLVNVVDDCGLPTDGVTDATTLMRACRIRYPGRHLYFPKNRAYNSSTCDYTFNSSAITTTEATATSEWWDGAGGTGGMAENAASSVRICFASGVTGIEPPANSNGFTITNIHLIGSECWTWTDASTYILPFGWGGTSTADGIRAHARMKISNVTAECFGRHGFNFDTDGYTGNLNTTTVSTSFANKNRGAGVFIRGADSNAGRFEGISATFNQLDGIVETSFLGNNHIGHHTDANGDDGSTVGAAISITNSVINNNYATLTAPAHGLSVGDYINITGSTCCQSPSAHFFVNDVVDANTFIVYTPTQDKLAAVETASAFKHTGGSAAWHKNLTGCAITSGLKILTCDSGGLSPYGLLGYPVTVTGAGVAGADLNSITVAAPTSFCTVTNWNITSNVLTVTCANSFTVGTVVKLIGFNVDDVREQEVTVATQSATNFTASLIHADVGAHATTGRVYFSTVSLKDAASTTVTGATGAIMYRSVPYRHHGNTNLSKFDNLYSEGDQFASIFWHSGLVLGGDHGADIDFNPDGTHWMKPTGNGLEFVSPRATIWSTGNQEQDLELTYQPGEGNSTLLRFYTFDTSTKAFVEGMRLTCALTCSLQNIAAGGTRIALAANSGGYTDLAPTLNATELRLNYQGSTAVTGTSVGFYNGSSTKVASVSNAGLGAFSAYTNFTGTNAATGLYRMTKTDTICWRNNANGADVCISLNGSDQAVLPAFTGSTASLSGQVTSTLATGTAPFSITSTTPVANLTTVPATYSSAGTQQAGVHLVYGKCTLGTDCSITLSGSAIFTGADSYECTATDQTAAAAVRVNQTSGSAVAFTGTGTDVIRYQCIGN
jgi:hypothetical protein